ncbi:MAG: hypothetical protein ACR2HS_05425, partial [Gammaproteobacteria bacterium]
VPPIQVANENSQVIFSTANNNSIVLSDPNVGSNYVTLVITPSNGTITLNPVNINGITINNATSITNSTSITLSGTLANLTAALEGMKFTPNNNFYGNTTIGFNLYDSGHGIINTTYANYSTNVNLQFNLVNQSPVNTMPANTNLNENSSFTKNFTVSDPDPYSANYNVQVTLVANNATITLQNLANQTGLTFITGDGIYDPRIVFTAPIATVNNILTNVLITPNLNYYGKASIVMTTNDLGNGGLFAPKSVTDTFYFNVNKTGIVPINNIPGTINFNENTSLVFAGNNLINIQSVGNLSDQVKVSLTAANGTISLDNTDLIMVSGSSTNSTSMTFTGTTANVNKALAGLIFNPTVNYTGSANIGITTLNLDGTNSSVNNTINMNVLPYNQAPANTTPGSITTNMNTTSAAFN